MIFQSIQCTCTCSEVNLCIISETLIKLSLTGYLKKYFNYLLTFYKMLFILYGISFVNLF